MVTSARLSSMIMVSLFLNFSSFINRNILILGKINTSEDLFRSYPVMDEERWSLTNKAKTASNATLGALKDELKQAYCQTRRLEVDRMGCN